jgi:hypothetical protein
LLSSGRGAADLTLVNKSRLDFMHRSAVSTHPDGGAQRRKLLLGLVLWSVASIARAAIDASPLILEHLTTADGLP